MKILSKLGFDIGYLALLTRDQIKPLSRWEDEFSRREIKALRHLGLKTDTVERKLLNGGTITELIFSKSSRYLDFYTRKFYKTPLRKDRQAVTTEGFLFGYPNCCVKNFAENGYTENDFVGDGQEILFHWACPGCRATPELLPYYQKTYRECREIRAAQRYPFPEMLRKSLPAAALSLLFALTPGRALADDPHWLPLGAEDPDGDYLRYSEEILLGTHTCFHIGEDPNGPREALKFSAIINSLSETPSDTSCYVENHVAFGEESCQVCGETMNMGFLSIHNPMRDMVTFIPYMGIHFMEHGGFSYDGTSNSGRVDIKLLKEVLAHYDSSHFAIETSNDLDDDGLTDDYESYFGTQINDPDSDDDQLEDGPEVAEQFIEAIAEFPVVALGETPPDDSCYVMFQLMDGLETCHICGISINMGNVKIANPSYGREITFPIIGLHYLAHSRFAFWGTTNSGEIDALQLADVLDILTSAPSKGPLPKQSNLLLCNYPNPFNAGTKIEFSLPQAGYATLRIYNLNGQTVRTLLNRSLQAGSHRVSWDGLDENGVGVASGVYFCQLEHGGLALARKLLFLK